MGSSIDGFGRECLLISLTVSTGVPSARVQCVDCSGVYKAWRASFRQGRVGIFLAIGTLGLGVKARPWDTTTRNGHGPHGHGEETGTIHRATSGGTLTESKTARRKGSAGALLESLRAGSVEDDESSQEP